MAKSLLKSTGLVSGNTLISRILGFVRDVVFAHFFGAVGGFDAFIVAFKIPQFMRRMFAEGAFSQAFVPVLSEYRERHTHAEVQRFISDMAGSLGSVLFLFVIVAIIASPLIVSVFGMGFAHNSARFILATHMLRITFPYLLFISLTALCAAVLNTYDSFGVPAFTPALLNLSLIFAAIFLSPHLAVPVYGLAWGLFFAGILQLLFQLPFMHRKNLLPKPKIGFGNPAVQRVLKLMVPAIFGVSVAQISLLLDTVFASFLKVGSISWLYYSDRLMNFPLGVFGVAIATVMLPKLSRQHASKDLTSYSKTIDWSLRLLLLIGIPSSIGLLILAGPLLSTLFQYGKFTNYDVIMARKSLMMFSIGIQFFMLIKVLASGFYARQDIKTPVKIAVVALVINMISNVILIFPMAHAGLALSTSIAAVVNSGLLLIFLVKRKYYLPESGWIKYFVQIGLSVFLMSSFLLWQMPALTVWMQKPWFYRALHLAFLVVGAFLVYMISLYVSGVRVKHFRESHIFR